MIFPTTGPATPFHEKLHTASSHIQIHPGAENQRRLSHLADGARQAETGEGWLSAESRASMRRGGAAPSRSADASGACPVSFGVFAIERIRLVSRGLQPCGRRVYRSHSQQISPCFAHVYSEAGAG